MKNVLKFVGIFLLIAAAVAGVAYTVATYGDRIVAWFKKLLKKGECCCECDCECDEECECECECACECEEAEAEAAAEEEAVVAEQNDFEG